MKRIEEHKLSQDLILIARRTARIIINTLETEDKVFSYFLENDLHNGILSYSEAIELLLKVNSNELRRNDINLLLKELDTQNVRQFCCHSLPRRIVELAQDNASISAVLRRIMSACTRKGPPLNNVNGFKQSFIGKDHYGRIATSRFRARLLEIVPGLVDSELKILETEFSSIDSGKIDLKRFAEALFSSELRKQSTILISDPKKTRKESISERSEHTSQQGLKGKIEELKKENDYLKREINALTQKIAKLEKTTTGSKIEYRSSLGRSEQGIPKEMLQYSERISELEKNNYELLKEIDTKYKPLIGKYKETEERLKIDMKYLKLENLKLQSQIERMLKKTMDNVDKKHELDYIRDTKISEQDKKIQSLTDEVKKAEERTFDLEQKLLDLQFEKENFDLERSRMERRIKDLELFQ